MVHLYLVGTHHLDLKGPERLRKFLDWTKPDTIGIEISSKGVRKADINHAIYSSTVGQFLLGREYPNKVTSTLLHIYRTIGYEVWIPLEFKTANPGTELLFCEENKDSAAARNKVLKVFRNRADVEVDVSKIDCEEYQRKVDAKYDNHSLEEKLKNPELFPLLFTYRDTNAERKIRKALCTSQLFVYVGGFSHFFGDYSPNLYDRLHDLNPIRIKLKDVDKF